jgi:hypothetical protein
LKKKNSMRTLRLLRPALFFGCVRLLVIVIAARARAGATPTSIDSPLVLTSIIPTPRPAFRADEAYKHVVEQMARTLDADKTRQEIWLTFFDAEDNGRLDGWDWGTGSTDRTQNLTVLGFAQQFIPQYKWTLVRL